MPRMKEFYEKAFGWKLNQLGPEMNNYVTAQTTETAENGFPKETGRINGGLYQKTPANNLPSIVIGVEDIQEHVKLVKDVGGTIMNEPMMIPGVGMFASFKDPEGNILSMLQPLEMTQISQ